MIKMKQPFLLITFICLGFLNVFGQIDFEDVKINEMLRLKVDSFALGEVNAKGNRLTGFLHYTVTNISDDTIAFNTNGCSSYNQYIFEINDTIYRTNKGVRCVSRNGRLYYLLPNQSITKKEIMYDNFSSLESGITKLKLTIPGDVRRPFSFCIDGQSVMKNIANLTFEGEVLIVEN